MWLVEEVAWRMTPTALSKLLVGQRMEYILKGSDTGSKRENSRVVCLLYHNVCNWIQQARCNPSKTLEAITVVTSRVLIKRSHQVLGSHENDPLPKICYSANEYVEIVSTSGTPESNHCVHHVNLLCTPWWGWFLGWYHPTCWITNCIHETSNT